MRYGEPGADHCAALGLAMIEKLLYLGGISAHSSGQSFRYFSEQFLHLHAPVEVQDKCVLDYAVEPVLCNIVALTDDLLQLAFENMLGQILRS